MMGAGTGTRTPGLLITSNRTPSAVLTGARSCTRPTVPERTRPSYQLTSKSLRLTFFHRWLMGTEHPTADHPTDIWASRARLDVSTSLPTDHCAAVRADRHAETRRGARHRFQTEAGAPDGGLRRGSSSVREVRVDRLGGGPRGAVPNDCFAVGECRHAEACRGARHPVDEGGLGAGADSADRLGCGPRGAVPNQPVASAVAQRHAEAGRGTRDGD